MNTLLYNPFTLYILIFWKISHYLHISRFLAVRLITALLHPRRGNRTEHIDRLTDWVELSVLSASCSHSAASSSFCSFNPFLSEQNRTLHTRGRLWPKTPYVSAPLFNSFSVSPWSRMENNLKGSLFVVLQSATLQRAPIFEKSNRLYLKTLTDNNILFLAVRGWQTFTIFPKFSGMVVFSWSLSRAVYRIGFKSGSTKFKPRLNYFQFYSLACMSDLQQHWIKIKTKGNLNYIKLWKSIKLYGQHLHGQAV